MEVDPPLLVPSNGNQDSSSLSPSTSPLPDINPLKRSNSAPMINVLVSSTSPITTSTTTTTDSSLNTSMPVICIASSSVRNERMRRYSTSSCLHSPTTPVKATSRVDLIKREENLSVKDAEASHENKTHSNIQLNLSWENLNMDDAEPMATDGKRPCPPKSFQEPLHIFTSPFPYASSPSPTRIGKQCFSPSLQQPVRGISGNLTPSPSPSPTRKTFVRRSMSPIALRPSPLGGAVKRKMEIDTSDKMDTYFSPPKRLHMTMSPGSAVMANDKHVTHPLMQSVPESSNGSLRSSSPLPHSSGVFAVRTPLIFSVPTTASPVASTDPQRPTPLQPATSTGPTHHQADDHRALVFQGQSHALQGSGQRLGDYEKSSAFVTSASFLQEMKCSSDFKPVTQGGDASFTPCTSMSSSTTSLAVEGGRSHIAAPRVVTVTRPQRTSSPYSGTAASVFGTFRPVVRDSVDSAMSTGGTDSEASDMAETTDLSETSETTTSLNLTDHSETNTPPPTLFNQTAKSTQV